MRRRTRHQRNRLEISPQQPPAYYNPQRAPTAEYAPGPRGLQPELSGVFDGTPYEIAPPDVQRHVIVEYTRPYWHASVTIAAESTANSAPAQRPRCGHFKRARASHPTVG